MKDHTESRRGYRRHPSMIVVGGIGYAIATGLSARPTPSSIETRLARSVRRLAVPREMRERVNPFGIEHRRHN